ncbi:MAG: cytidylate kinase-like family protein [Anaerolineales bacterium]|jgi:cytidylate kinase|nr:cytidylate kinase-like family protein [Anaerolineales bacterium]
MAVITLSRQLESGGDEVARQLCEKLGYQYFDKQAMAQAGQELGLAAGVIQSAVDFKPAAKTLLERWFGSTQRITGGDPSSWTFTARNDALQDLTIANLVDIIEAGYKKGNVVIVGRGGMAALQNKPDVFHVRILAPFEVRVKRLMQHEKLTLEEAEKKMRERDLSDVEWIHRYFGLDYHEPSLFDIVINTAKYTPAQAADLVLKAFEAFSAKAK